MESQQFDVQVPDANSLEIHFDPRCSTGPGDMLRLYLLENAIDSSADGPSRRAFAQREGHKNDFPKEPLLLKNIGESVGGDGADLSGGGGGGGGAAAATTRRIVGISCEFPQRLAWGLKPVASEKDGYSSGIVLELSLIHI